MHFTVQRGGGFCVFPVGTRSCCHRNGDRIFYSDSCISFHFFLLAIIIAISRLVIGLNYPGDVIAGMILGMVTVVWLKAIFDRFAIELRADKRRL
jgi:hypothetical protein